MQWEGPQPRGDRTLEARVTRAVQELPSGVLSWDALSSRHYPGWLGVRLGALNDLGRGWTFDVHPGGEHSPLVLQPVMDIVAVKVWDRSRPWVRAKLVCELTPGCDDVMIPASVWPPEPWKVEVFPGWSTKAVAGAVMGWIATKVGRDDLLLCADDVSEGDGTRALGESVRATEDALDALLAMEPHDAAVVCAVLGAFAESLGQSFE
jgi:hypothetical protein